ncbi:DNA gyrase inhibitor YacG [Amorphus orientalis]|uniref:DNA gyrase inhibitor YacG n=1 Tax=Amorphus orientalis TaxID=649198 RepID=A0AAE3VR30_9HYPH|nr:DNA gyrase inhibitor YacG [Amorphus orientalis]MDQ0316774.1 endogenous inhibitor of DNA gyrase (YacG/DUF329 family) [Amorphus orientalis]
MAQDPKSAARTGQTVAKGRGKRSCPICGKPTDDAYRPFCSKRCADIDLGKWLGGTYAIPVVEEDGSAGSGGPDDD